ncbi:hypothetical protein HHO41_09015 [Bacillus sp. DNRA2]|uniref:hypothetical protein n=1 Tax=Bacillus sp. DNRA2 TaxID=2723053 RepID=UPI00145FCCA5|nr:hypothetical protein [Bacillus sp. DNRA2]NMD70434.1 hypothetical protein [Bacillus sp. DNRA2]
MNKIIDFVEYKRQKKREKITEFFNKYKVLLGFIVIFLASITIWTVVSFKVAMITMAVAVLVPLVLSKKSYLPVEERLPISKPQ